MSSRTASRRRKNVHQLSDLEGVYPVRVQESLPKHKLGAVTRVKVLHMTPIKYKPKFFGKNLKDSLAIIQAVYFSREKAQDNALSALLAERPPHNLKNESAYLRPKILRKNFKGF